MTKKPASVGPRLRPRITGIGSYEISLAERPRAVPPKLVSQLLLLASGPIVKLQELLLHELAAQERFHATRGDLNDWRGQLEEAVQKGGPLGGLKFLLARVGEPTV